VWASLILVGGVMIAIAVSVTVGAWLKTIQVPALINQVMQGAASTPDAAPPDSVTSLSVQRSASYAGLAITVITANYAPAFADDAIQAGPALLRLNLRVANATSGPVRLLYYDIAHLLVPRQSPIAPTNLHLSTGPAPGRSELGWLDFPAPAQLAIDQLALQLGSASLNEHLVTIPLRGPFDPRVYEDRTSPQSLSIIYNFLGHALTYHLASIHVATAYHGNQCRAGQRYYIFTFRVDNGNGVDVTPGYAFDYIRLALSGHDQPPADVTLPNTFKAGSGGTPGQVAFAAPANLTTLTIGFLPQTGAGEQYYGVAL
jgi:hypothetical protein